LRRRKLRNKRLPFMVLRDFAKELGEEGADEEPAEDGAAPR
jgi:hypothetical protein